MKNYSLIFICFSTVFFSCSENKQHAIETKPVKKAIGKLVTDSIAPPIITAITPAKKKSVTVTSKPYSLDPRMGKEAITTITPANGLPLGRFYRGFVQDYTGNLWFANGTNIIKYDGQNFISYPLVPGKNVYCNEIAIDSNNELWVVIFKSDSTGAGEVAGLYVFNGNSFEPLPVMQSGLRPNSFDIRLFPQPDGAIWVLMNKRKQIMKFVGRQLKQTITPNDFSFRSISEIKSDRQGNIWFSDPRDSTLTRYDGKTFKKLTHADGLPKTSLYEILPLSADSIYISTSNGTYFFNGQKSTKTTDNRFSNLLLDNQGTLWLDNEKEVGVSKISSAGIASIRRDDGLGLGSNWSLETDNEENVWILSENSFNRLYKPVVTYGDVFPTSGSSYGIRAFHNDGQGNYWFGSFLSGISSYNGNTLTNYSFLNKGTEGSFADDNNIGDIKQDKTGNLWISTFQGSLIKYDGQSFFAYNKSNDFGVRWIVNIEADSKGNIWFPKIVPGFGRYGVACFNGKEMVSYTTAQGLCDNIVNSIYEDSKGTMWFGTANGLSRFKNGRFTTFNAEDGLANNAINAITEDEYGNIWLGTGGGISRFDGEQFINYTPENGLIAGAVEKIEKDAVNNLFWLASDVGFSAMKFKANHPDSVLFENYSETDGFPLKGFLFNIMVDQAGALWTSEGNNSIKRFDYKKVKANSKPFNLHITQIRLNNETICWSNLKDSRKDSLALQMEMQLRFGKLLNDDELEQKASQFSAVRYDSIIPADFIPYNLSLPYKANSISFDFAAIDPHFSKSTRYQYMLDGFNKTWSPLSKNTNANFGNLGEGSYTFKLKALNPYGIWSEMSYSFKVLPPWYRTWWAYALYILLFVAGIYTFIRWRTKALQKEKIVLEQKVATRTSELKESLENLKATQSQLIQSEKMASLGELTAGIAHEIQNPLNFVNNFSEVNTELIDEAGEEIDKGNVSEAKIILNDIKENEQKINHHGKRADAIVKGMLQHSRSSSGVKEPTDINALCDEYLRLAYHGLRAKDKSFNAAMKTHFDESIGNINIIPQDIGRVVLNLINNAFYVVDEKKKSGFENYEPTVWVSTKKLADKIEIKVADNGNGIPQKVLDKIFQPFFTTKPTGQGTGLGLSLSYDIIKAHGGELKVETKEGEGSEFIIKLPIA
jgi:signal transduction histidine kinase/ligand-binding sensor domain-containing protein